MDCHAATLPDGSCGPALTRRIGERWCIKSTSVLSDRNARGYTIKSVPRQAPERHKPQGGTRTRPPPRRIASGSRTAALRRSAPCKQTYRVMVLRKKLIAAKGRLWLFQPDRYFFHTPSTARVRPRRSCPGLLPVRPGKPDCPVEERSEGAGDAGGRHGEQLGLLGDHPGPEMIHDGGLTLRLFEDNPPFDLLLSGMCLVLTGSPSEARRSQTLAFWLVDDDLDHIAPSPRRECGSRHR
jgi:hypothetical protein